MLNSCASLGNLEIKKKNFGNWQDCVNSIIIFYIPDLVAVSYTASKMWGIFSLRFAN